MSVIADPRNATPSKTDELISDMFFVNVITQTDLGADKLHILRQTTAALHCCLGGLVRISEYSERSNDLCFLFGFTPALAD